MCGLRDEIVVGRVLVMCVASMRFRKYFDDWPIARLDLSQFVRRWKCCEIDGRRWRTLGRPFDASSSFIHFRVGGRWDRG